MSRHLAKCAVSPGQAEPWLHILAEGRYSRGYWLHLRVGARATLAHLDGFLRDIWLECCGHLSEFVIYETSYASEGVDYPEAAGMNVAVSQVVGPGDRFSHTYDFGSSTELSLRVVAERQGAAAREKVILLARNRLPEIACDTCGAPARRVCNQCSWGESGFLCDKCAETHDCGDETLLPIVNSPRVGVCGYTG